MKIAVVCANGKAGRLIVDEALKRGLDVTAVVRGENKTNAPHTIKKDILDLKAEDLKGFDVVIDAFGVFEPSTLHLYSDTQKILCDALSRSETRLLIIGGAGSLYVNPEHKKQYFQTDGFPEIYMPVATAAAKALSELRSRDDVKWTYISPASDFQAEGERTGKYILAGEELTFNAKGESVISYADYAIAMVDEAISGKHIRQRISVVKE